MRSAVGSIGPVPPGAPRPLWSVMIPTYNRSRYLRETIESVLAQAPGPDEMQIEVVDNVSTEGDIAALVGEIGRGRITFFRQPRNVGMTNNWNTCVERARGYLVHVLHDDDLVMPGFYARLAEGFEQEPAAGAAFCRYMYVEEDGRHREPSPVEREVPGVLEGWLREIVVRQRIQCPAIAVRRSTYEAVGGFHPELIYAVDWEMWQRIAAHYPIWYEPQVLAGYRMHAAAATSRLLKTAADVEDVRRAIRIAEAYLPAAARRWAQEAKTLTALRAVGTARRMFDGGEARGALAQLREGLRCSRSPVVLYALGQSIVWTARRTIRRSLARTAGFLSES